MHRAYVALSIAAAVLCACDDDVSGGLGFVRADLIPDAYKDAICTYDVRCGLFPDKPTCLAAQLDTSVALDPNVLAAIAESRISYNGNYVAACFEAIADQTCDVTDIAGRIVPIACRHFTRGNVGAGNSCYRDEECVSASCEGGDTETTCQLGICIGDVAPTVEPAAYNKPCNPVGGCVSTTYCNTEMNLCLMLKLEGMACAKNDECAFGLGCAGGTCKPLPALGEPCPDHVCRDDGTLCDFATTQTGMPLCVKAGLTGAPCVADGDCAPSYRCDPATSTCTELPRTGQSCAFIGRCFDEGTFCDSTGHCVSQRADGESCATPGECAGGICDASVCRSPTICAPPA